MNPKAQNIINQLNNFTNPVIIETGCIRRTEPEYEQGDGHSTYYIAQWIKEHGGTFFSIDIKTDKAKEFIKSKGLGKYVTFIQTIASDILRDIDDVDFCYLDSANDANTILKEFMSVWPNINAGGIVMADDCNEASKELCKGDLLMPYLREHDIKYEQLETNQIVIKK